MFEWYDDQWSWVLTTRETSFTGTYAIVLSFVFIAYILHPAVEKAYQRVRAYRGWRAIEIGQTVEVTTYPLVSEIRGVRGRWDTARIVAMLLAAFSLASWGLELRMDLKNIEESVTDLFLRPPPVWKSNASSDNGAWYVIPQDELVIVEGEVPNMFENFSVGTANARYKVENIRGIIKGKVRIASWNTGMEDITTHFFYDENREGIGHVKNTNCSSGEKPVDLYMGSGGEHWGTVVDCKDGPQKFNGSDDSTTSVVKLVSAAKSVYFIVEESSTYPSFLYSVWTTQNATDESVTLHHVFHISSSARLAEAVVTEIVHADKEGRVPTGGRSFALLRVFSENNSSYGMGMEERASPFGEHPMGEEPNVSLSTIESIEEGVKLDTTALLCAVWILALALVGIVAWSLLLRSSVEMDVYDRDELIRAVTLAGSDDSAEHSSKMRIFVKKGEGGNLSVSIEYHPSNCLERYRKKHQVVPINDPIPKYPTKYPCESGGPVVPSRPRTVWLEGVRMGKGRAYPGRRGNYRYPTSIALIASPVPSPAGSIAGTPVHQSASPTEAPPSIRQFLGMDPALFDSVRSLGNCEGNDAKLESSTVSSNKEPKAKLCDEPGSPCLYRSESHITEVCVDLRGLRSLSESTTRLHGRSLMSPPARLTTGSSFRTPEGFESSPANPSEETKDYPDDQDEAKIAEAGGEPVHDGDNELV